MRLGIFFTSAKQNISSETNESEDTSFSEDVTFIHKIKLYITVENVINNTYIL